MRGSPSVNVCSSPLHLQVETCDGKRGRRYKQTFTKNMSKKGEPVITDCGKDENWTCITFYPDLERFGMAELEEETVQLMRKRVYDMAGILGKTVKVGALSGSVAG